MAEVDISQTFWRNLKVLVVLTTIRASVLVRDNMARYSVGDTDY